MSSIPHHHNTPLQQLHDQAHYAYAASKQLSSIACLLETLTVVVGVFTAFDSTAKHQHLIILALLGMTISSVAIRAFSSSNRNYAESMRRLSLRHYATNTHPSAQTVASSIFQQPWYSMCVERLARFKLYRTLTFVTQPTPIEAYYDADPPFGPEALHRMRLQSIVYTTATLKSLTLLWALCSVALLILLTLLLSMALDNVVPAQQRTPVISLAMSLLAGYYLVKALSTVLSAIVASRELTRVFDMAMQPHIASPEGYAAVELEYEIVLASLPQIPDIAMWLSRGTAKRAWQACVKTIAP